jgi:hypothetical protein
MKPPSPAIASAAPGKSAQDIGIMSLAASCGGRSVNTNAFIMATAVTTAMGLGGLASVGRAAFAWRSRIRLADAVAGWGRAEGEILTAEVVVHRTADGDAYEPRVCYFAAAAIARYHRGATVVVRVDPTNHSRSALETEPVTSGLQSWLALGVTLLATAALLWITLA